MSASEEFLNIDTPENVIFGYEVAGIGSRFIAAIIDTFLIFTLIIIGTLGILFVAALASDVDTLLSNPDDSGFLLAFALIALVNFFFLWGYYLLFEVWWNGQSPGKRLIGLRVIRTDGTPMDFSESIIRNLVRIVDFLPGYYMIGFITMFISQQTRRLGDYAAGTLVVYDKGNVSLDSLKQENEPRRIPYHPLKHGEQIIGLPIEKLSDDDIAIAENYLARRLDLIQGNAELGSRLANQLLTKMGVPERNLTHWQATELLEALVATRYREPEVNKGNELSQEPLPKEY